MRKLVQILVLATFASAGGGCLTPADPGDPDLGTETSQLFDLNACLTQACPWIDCPAVGCWAVYTEELCYCLAEAGDEPTAPLACHRGAMAAMRECIRSTPF